MILLYSRQTNFLFRDCMLDLDSRKFKINWKQKSFHDKFFLISIACFFFISQKLKSSDDKNIIYKNIYKKKLFRINILIIFHRNR